MADPDRVNPDRVMTDPFFEPFDDDRLFGANGSAAAEETAVRRKLLADGIPALSFAMGANELDDFEETISNIKKSDVCRLDARSFTKLRKFIL